MIVIVSAIIIFILLCASATLALVVPIRRQITEAEARCATDNVLLTLAQHSKNVPVIIDVIGW